MKKNIIIRAVALIMGSIFFIGLIQNGFSASIQKRISGIQTSNTTNSFNPFEEGWFYRKQIAINHTKITDDLTNFPVLIHIIDSDLQVKAQTDGDDILFMDAIDVATQLHHEIESYDSSNGELFAWVNITYLSSTIDTIFYMYYGNPTANNQENPEQVWAFPFLAVWHLNNNPIGQIIDSTSNKNNGISNGGMTMSDLVNGKIGPCLDFDGTDDFISFSEFTNSQNEGTCIAWVKTISTAIGTVWGEAKITADKPYIVCGKYYDDNLWFARDISGGSTNYLGLNPLGMNDGHWHQVAWLSYGSGNGNAFYFDGQPVSLTWQDGHDPNGIWFDDQVTVTHSLGARERPTGRDHWAGPLDEIRIVSIPLSAAWIATEYANQNVPSSFCSIKPEETSPLKTTIIFGRITNLNTQGNFISFNAVKLRCIQFSPFSSIPYQSNERVMVSIQYLGVITPKIVFAVCQAYIFRLSKFNNSS